MTIPEACPEVYAPVCGCDGVTYSNACFADMAGVAIDYRGPCREVCGGIAGVPCEDEDDFCKLPPGSCDIAGLSTTGYTSFDETRFASTGSAPSVTVSGTGMPSCRANADVAGLLHACSTRS